MLFYFERINTMLKLKFLFANYALAKRALENWEFDKESLDKLLSYFRISSNAIYPFYQNGTLCFLRLAPTEEKLEKNVFGELEFIQYLNANGYAALKPVKSKCGSVVLKLVTEWGTYYATVFKKVDGKQIEQTDYSNEIMYEYGRALGKLHSLSSAFVPKVKKWAHSEVLEWIKQTVGECNAPPFVLAEVEAVKAELSSLAVNTGCYGLVHYDFEPDNVFYDESTKTCAVIDFDDGMYHWYSLDIEQVFDSLSSELDGEKLEKAKVEFIKGYETEHIYSEEMKRSLPVMGRFCNLFKYSRIIRSVYEHFSDEPDWLAELRKELNLHLKKLELSMQSQSGGNME